MRIPRNTQSILDKLSKAKPAKKVTTPVPVVKEKEAEIEAGSGREAAKLRQRAKKAEAELETLRAQLAELTTEVETLRPAAQQWKNYEHVERQKLLQSLPPELKADAKTMQLNHLRLFVKRESAPAVDKGKPPVDKMDLDALQKSGDKKAINEYVEGVKKGTITPVMPKEEAV